MQTDATFLANNTQQCWSCWQLLRPLLSGVFQVSDYAKKNFGKKELSLILLPNECEEIEKNLKLLNDLQCALNLEEDIRLHTDGLVFMKLYGNAKF